MSIPKLPIILIFSVISLFVYLNAKLSYYPIVDNYKLEPFIVQKLDPSIRLVSKDMRCEPKITYKPFPFRQSTLYDISKRDKCLEQY